jgi:hypothetical protein
MELEVLCLCSTTRFVSYESGSKSLKQSKQGTQQFYSSGADGVFRVWEYGSLEVAVRPDEADNWDL